MDLSNVCLKLHNRQYIKIILHHNWYILIFSSRMGLCKYIKVSRMLAGYFDR